MDTQRVLAVALVIVVVLGATPALAAIASYSVPTSGDVPISTDETPTITLSSADYTDVNYVDVWEGDELNISVTEGRIRVSGDPGASATLNVDDIEGTQTHVTNIDAGSAWLELNPADKNRVDVRGDVDTLAFSEIGDDDGSADLQVGGPAGGSAEFRLYGLSANTQYALYDASRDEVLGEATADGSGTLTVTSELPDGTHALQVRTADSFAEPTVSNPQPTGTVSDRPDELSVDVTADAWPAEVEFTLNGSVVGTQEVTSDGTVTQAVTVDDLGEFNYSATITDGVGNTDTVEASFETPNTITLYEEDAPHEVIENSTVSIRFFTAGGDLSIQREAPNGTVDMEGLPDTEFVVFAESPNHYDRTIYIESIYEQESMFLLNESEYPLAENDAVRSRFLYEDFTGDFPTQDTTIQIERAIDLNGDGESEFRTVTGDYWGASNDFESVLEYGTRYRITLTNQETGDTYRAGTHIPTEDLTQTIRVTGLVVEAQNATGVTTDSSYDAANQTIDLVYRDPANATDELTVSVVPRGGGDPIYNTTVAGPLGTYHDSVALNDTQAEGEWVVEYDAGSRHQAAIPVGSGAVGLPVVVPSWLMTLLMSMFVTFVGALYGPRTAVLGAWSMVFVAAGASMFGWAFSGPSVIIAALVAVGSTFIARTFP